MPIYEYRCEQGHTFEVLRRMSDEPVSSCQTCDAPVHQVFHPIAVHFKGKGFYSTDYGTSKRARELREAAEGKSSSQKDSSSSENGASSSDSSSSGASSDSAATASPNGGKGDGGGASAKKKTDTAGSKPGKSSE